MCIEQVSECERECCMSLTFVFSKRPIYVSSGETGFPHLKKSVINFSGFVTMINAKDWEWELDT